ncbi:mechanosensitive ion channel [Reticulomyxa filosa]|uniref:Mechanosensitive ion channel n=1 Tax=Reticulomyxa filosa TaxID=46433 RepID=X6PH59_RETFI|nr:mechanosensitive ion channel [Reticulomyxa filosa]|eukprot:ETO37032.1 mechanosensitive ion channel [Reticulomyxa filosa]
MGDDKIKSGKRVRGYLIEKDFCKLFGRGRRFEARHAFRRFDGGQRGRITYANLHRRLYRFLADTINARQTVLNSLFLFVFVNFKKYICICIFIYFTIIYTLRLFVMFKYNSYQDILENLDAIVSLLVFFVSCFVFLLIFRYDVATAISMYASVLALMLIFGSSALTSVINGVILIYLIQPFSVGDVVNLNNNRYTVKQMGLTSTFFETSWGTPAIWSNTQILNYLQGMLNFSKSRSETHNIEFYVSQETTNKQLESFKKLFMIYIKRVMPMVSNDNVKIVFFELDNMGRTRVCLWIESLFSFSNGRARWSQHSEIIFGVRKILEDLNIKMYWPLPSNFPATS